MYFVSLGKASRESHEPFPENPPYMDDCFLAVQDRIEKGFVEASSGKQAPSVNMQRFTYPAVSEDAFVAYALIFFPILFVISMLHAMRTIIKVSDTFVQ